MVAPQHECENCENYTLTKYQGYHAGNRGVIGEEDYEYIQDLQNKQKKYEEGWNNQLAYNAKNGHEGVYTGDFMCFDVLTVRHRHDSKSVTLKQAIDAALVMSENSIALKTWGHGGGVRGTLCQR